MSEVQVKTSITIDGDIVELISKQGDISIYESSHSSIESKFYYFTKNNKVLFTQLIEADCGQNQGFVSNVEFVKNRENRTRVQNE